MTILVGMTGSLASTRDGHRGRMGAGSTGSPSVLGEITSVCAGIGTIANASMVTPGVVTHSCDSLDPIFYFVCK